MRTAIPSKLGRYEVLEELGKGSMGVVYLARDPLIGRLVALKTFHVAHGLGESEIQQFHARFLREAQSCGILSHPNIVTIHDIVVPAEPGDVFMAMEYVRGSNLKQLLQRAGTPELEFTARVVCQVADALDYAHSKGVVHRDVKPANILLTADNQVKITDFGIALLNTSNLTQDGQLLGTPNYMAPEQIRGAEVDHRADIFSLGVVLYEMLTRRKPFPGDNLTVVTYRIVNEEFEPPEKFIGKLHPGLRSILERSLAKSANDRFSTASEMAAELRRLLPEATAPLVGENTAELLAETMASLPGLDLPELVPRSAPELSGSDTRPPLVATPPDPPAAASVAAAPAASGAAFEPPPPLPLPEPLPGPLPAAGPASPPVAAPAVEESGEDTEDGSATRPPLPAPAGSLPPPLPPPPAIPVPPRTTVPPRAAGPPPPRRAALRPPATHTAPEGPGTDEAVAPPPAAGSSAGGTTAAGSSAAGSTVAQGTVVGDNGRMPGDRRRLMLVAAVVLVALVLAALTLSGLRRLAGPEGEKVYATERARTAERIDQLMAEGRSLLVEDRIDEAEGKFQELVQIAEARRGVVRESYRLRLADGDRARAEERSRELEWLAGRVEEVEAELQVASDRRQHLAFDAVRRDLLTDKLEIARRALEEARLEEARGAALAALEVDPANAEAYDVLAQVEPLLARSARAEPRSAPPPPPPVAALPEPAPERVLAAAPPPPAAPLPDHAQLEVSFTSDLPRGVLLVYFNDDQLLREDFRFVEKSGLFKRPRSFTGSLQRSFKVATGTNTLKVYVSGARNRPTEVEQLSANFPPGSTRRLIIRVTEDGDMDASLQ